MKNLVFFIVVASFMIASCKKEYVGNYNSDFNGEWHSDTLTDSKTGRLMEIYILFNEARSEYGFACSINCNACECQDLFYGVANINRKHKKIRLGSNGERAKIKINEFPHLENGQMVCTLNDVKMYKR